MNKNIIKWLWAIVLITIFAPFYLLGATLGMFIGTVIRGYKDNLNFIREISSKLWGRK